VGSAALFVADLRVFCWPHAEPYGFSDAAAFNWNAPLIAAALLREVKHLAATILRSNGEGLIASSCSNG
jgi:hypothetical protein